MNRLIDEIEKAIFNTNISSICINDSSLCPDEDFEIIDTKLREWLDIKFPCKSSFEI